MHPDPSLADSQADRRSLLRNLALQDFIVLGFQAYLLARAVAAPASDDAYTARKAMSVLFALTVTTLVLTRGEVMAKGFARSLVYRVGLLAPMLGSYFALKWCLPALQEPLLDSTLYRIDRALFGETPAVLFDDFITRGRVEWFAFFYYGYFFLLAAYVLHALIFDQGRPRYELLLGTVIVVVVGHSLYTIVPGVGPHVYCTAMFHHELIGGVFWGRVERVVGSSGAMRDIFPSLHTALPVLFALHSLRYRGSWPHRFVWVAVLVCAANMIGATLFLRWHYAIDLIAGALLALGAHGFAIAAWGWEESWRRGGSRQEIWERLAPPYMESRDFNHLVLLFMIQITAVALAACAHP